MNYKVILEAQEEGGFTAYVPVLPGCVSQGESEDETLENIKEAIELYLDSIKSRGITPPSVMEYEVAI